MLDDLNVIKQKDSKNALGVAASEVDQLQFDAVIENREAVSSDVETIVVAGMGGSALAAGIAKSWLNVDVPFEIVKNYEAKLS